MANLSTGPGGVAAPLDLGGDMTAISNIVYATNTTGTTQENVTALNKLKALVDGALEKHKKMLQEQKDSKKVEDDENVKRHVTMDGVVVETPKDGMSHKEATGEGNEDTKKPATVQKVELTVKSKDDEPMDVTGSDFKTEELPKEDKKYSKK